MEIRKEVKTYRVTKACLYSDCKGEMMPTGDTLLTYPPQYVHRWHRMSLYGILWSPLSLYIDYEEVVPNTLRTFTNAK